MTDYNDVRSVGILISQDGQRVWVCVDGTCVLRAKGISEYVGVTDERPAEDPPELKHAFLTVYPSHVEFVMGDGRGSEPINNLGILLQCLIDKRVDTIEFRYENSED